MQAIFISTLASGNAVAGGGMPFMDTCSLALFIGGAFLLAMAVYHLRRAPEQVKHPVIVPTRR